jgi:D-amino peptidase
MKVLISADMEGVTGITRAAELSPGPDYPTARRWMTEDVNAAVAGIRRRDVDAEITVEENHGAEDTCVLDLDLLDPDVAVVRGLVRGRTTTMAALDDTVDGLLLVGHHAPAGHPRGLLAHTAAGAFLDVRVDDVPRSEGAFFALAAAELGVPLLMVSGDDVTCAELIGLVPTVEVAVVKTALGMQAARHRPFRAAREAISDAAERGMKRLESGDVFLPQPGTGGHRLDLQLAPSAQWLLPLYADLGFRVEGDRAAIVVPTWARAWEKVALAAFALLRHHRAGVAEPDASLVADLR